MDEELGGEEPERAARVAELAERSGIDAGYLSDFEQGQRWLYYAEKVSPAMEPAACS